MNPRTSPAEAAARYERHRVAAVHAVHGALLNPGYMDKPVSEAAQHIVDTLIAHGWGPRSAASAPPQPARYGTTVCGLSPMQQAVLSLVAEGAENSRIAHHLHVSTETVRTHVKAALRKLGAANRAHAVAIAYQHHLLTLEGPTA